MLSHNPQSSGHVFSVKCVDNGFVISYDTGIVKGEEVYSSVKDVVITMCKRFSVLHNEEDILFSDSNQQ